MTWLTRLIERQIQKARLRGDLENLEGEGEPLRERPGDAFVEPGLAAGFRVMAEAGVVPEEITLKKRIAEQKARMADVHEPEKRKVEMKRLADLEMRLAIAQEARRKFIG